MDSKLSALYQEIAAIGSRFGAQRIVLFGSRARGDEQARSDVDLAVFGLPKQAWSDFEDAMDELPSLLSFDLVDMSQPISEELRANIEQEGIDLMTKFNEKYAKYCKAVQRLSDAVTDFRFSMPEIAQDVMRDAIIQRFEFSAELAWKTMREYLIEEEVSVPATPKGVIRAAYSAGLISKQEIWSDLLRDRNLTSHTYNEETARNIFARICTDYLYVLQELEKQLKE